MHPSTIKEIIENELSCIQVDLLNSNSYVALLKEQLYAISEAAYRACERNMKAHGGMETGHFEKFKGE